ncbi:MAG TPA: nickel pincer cofactor biosynthesis protein LarC [Candidatus Bathyarchaeia archaeon]|nr:nickel pincer cofactor biosynthesis protein LarC [Candidatus Bathyarchaeia archaeon]
MDRVTLIDSRTAGISGDMLLAAFIDAGADLPTIERMLQLIPTYYSKCKSIRLERKDVKMHGFRSCRVDIKISEDQSDTDADTFSKTVGKIAESSDMGEKATAFAINSANLLIAAESKVHGVQTSDTHLHEAGSADTLADILGVAAACDSLEIFEGTIYATPVAVGGGVVSFSHGTVSTPAPAVMEIMRQRKIPMVGGAEPSELTTPTGITMLASLNPHFVETYPEMMAEEVGYGAGTKEFVSGPNFLRVVLGRANSLSKFSDRIVTLETNLDDIAGEFLSYALQRLIDSGAKDAWITSAQFKKNRPGYVLHVICDQKDTEQFSRIIMEETGTLGVRYKTWDRIVLERSVRTVSVKLKGISFDVRVKSARDSTGKTVRVKPEADDIQEIARTLRLPAREVARMVEAQI